MLDWINYWIDYIVEISGFQGRQILLVTFPLTILQGIVTIFPFATIMIINVASMELAEAILYTWLSATAASIVAFIMFRYLFRDWFRRRLEPKLAKYEKWQKKMDVHGGWVVILLRSIPIFPNNIISFMAAISPISLGHYIWSTSIGMVSNIWLYGLIGSSLFVPESGIVVGWLIYAAFGLLLIVFFCLRALINKYQR